MNTEPANEPTTEQHPDQLNEDQNKFYYEDVNKTGRWGESKRWEVAVVIGLIFTIVAGTACALVLALRTGDDAASLSDIAKSRSHYDESSGEFVSNYVLPVRKATIVADSEELNYLRAYLGSRTFFTNDIPTSTSDLKELVNDQTKSPATRAAAWLTTVDTHNIEEDVPARFLLAYMYFNNGGSEWTNSDGWLSSDHDHCDWYGVKCCRDVFMGTSCTRDDGGGKLFGRIVELNLRENNLTGEFPQSLEFVTHLEVLNFSKNSMTGTLPEGLLPDTLMHLNLSYNNFSGTIPYGLNRDDKLSALLLQRNDFTNEFPNDLCANTFMHLTKSVYYLGVDCDEVTCDALCCTDFYDCYND